MRKNLLRSCLALSLLLAGQTVLAQSAFSPTVNGLRSSYQTRRAASADAEQERGSFIVTCSVDASAADIANQMIEMGGKIGALMGNQLIVDLPMSKLEDAAAIEGVLLIDLPGESIEKTDVTRKASHVDEAHQGKAEGQKDLPQAYTGKGVIIGLIDGGFDFTHPMFKDNDGKLRIKGVYMAYAESLRSQGESLDNITVTDDKGKTTQVSVPGAFITNPDVILDTLKMKDIGGSHGTHCAGIAAGRFMTDTKGVAEGVLGGMAPDAELILSDPSPSDKQVRELRTTYGSLKDINSMKSLWLMQKYAKEQNKPLIVSWSQNNHDGFHNGTSSQARYIGQYCKAGNIMALCSSNEGGDSMFIERKINQGKTLYINTDLVSKNAQAYGFIQTDKNIKLTLNVIDSKLNTVYKCNLPLSAQGLNDHEHEFSFKIGRSGTQKIWVYYDDYYENFDNDGDFRQYVYSGGLSLSINKGSLADLNGTQIPYVRIELDANGLVMEKDPKSTDGYTYTFELEVNSPDEDVTMYAWGDYYSLYATSMEQPERYTAGSSDHSMGDMNTSGEPVTIGAYVANNKGVSEGALVESKNEKVGRYASFSSYGYDLSSERRKYPDVVTPGYSVLSAHNSFGYEPGEWIKRSYSNQFKDQSEPRTYAYDFMSGTSMATPAAAGIIALWVQAANDKGKTLTNKDIKDIIAHSSETDDFTKADPLRYGSGKMNAYKGLLYVLDMATAVPELPTEHISATLNGRTLHISGDPDVQVSVYNLSGVKVLDTQAQSGIVELPMLPAGVYAVKIGTKGSTLIRL